MISRNSKLLIAVLVPITVALLATLVISVYSIRAKNSETAKLLSLSSEADEAKIRAHAIRALRLEAAEDIEAFENLVLSEDKFVSLIETIEEASRALKVDAKVVSVAKADKAASAEPVVIRVVVEAKGSWAGVFTFFRAVESLPYKIMVEESHLAKDNAEWRLRVVISLNSFN